MHKYSILISIFIISIPVISFWAEDCSKYTNEINEYTNTISGLKQEQVRLATTLNDWLKTMKSQYSSMPWNAFLTYYNSRFSVELWRYDSIPSIINGIIDNIDFSQKMYTYCTQKNYLEEVNNYNQSLERQAQEADNLKKAQEADNLKKAQEKNTIPSYTDSLKQGDEKLKQALKESWEIKKMKALKEKNRIADLKKKREKNKRK